MRQAIQQVEVFRMKKVLMIAYHFPPLAGSSGIQRTLRFVQHLPRFGWEPIVLSAHPRAYERCDSDLLKEVPTATRVVQAQAWDTARHFSLAGRYLGAMAQPDRWISWKFDGVRRGMQLIEELNPSAIWSTYPIASAHVIGAELQKRSSLPWIADFRDPMAQDNYPKDPRTWRSFRAVEDMAFQQASHCMFTTEGAERFYRERFPHGKAQFCVIENGYDEESFSHHQAEDSSPLNPGKLTILHSGIVYPKERDPTQLFEALSLLKREQAISPELLKVRFRASVHDALLRDLGARFDVSEMIELCLPLPYRQALAEMLRADALLVMQSSDCNDQVPAKIYEYLRARRPIVCLSDPAGDTAGVLRRAGISAIARLDSAAEIAQLLRTQIQLLQQQRGVIASEDAILRSSRQERARDFAAVLNAAIAAPRKP